MRTALLLITLCTIPMLANAQKQPEYAWGKATGGADVAIDSKGFIYTVGGISDVVTINGQYYTSKGYQDILLTKLDDKGNIIWIKQYGDTAQEYATTIHIDAQDNIYLYGWYSNKTVFGGDTLVSNGYEDHFVLKLDNAGSYLWSKSIGTSGAEVGYQISNGICTDNRNNLLVATVVGNYYRVTPDTITFANKNYIVDSLDFFILKYSSTGDEIWAKQISGGSIVGGSSIATDKYDNIYTTGSYSGTVYFDTAKAVSSTNSYGRIFIAKHDSSGKLLMLITPDTSGPWYGSSGGSDIAIGKDNDIYIGGGLYDRQLKLGDNTINPHASFLAKFDASGNVHWATTFDDTINSGLHICLDENDNIYAANSEAYKSSNTTIAKYNSSGNLIWSNDTGPHKYQPSVFGLSCTNAGTLYITGVYSHETWTITFGNDTLLPIRLIPPLRSFLARVGPFPAGISQHQNNSDTDITLYPNPNNGQFTISGDGLKSFTGYAVYNSIGQQVHKDVLSKQASASIDLPELPTGFYTMQLSSNDGVELLKFIVP